MIVFSRSFFMPSEYTHIIHPFPPFYASDSRILILGSLPSVKSRENGFFYGNKQNRFWKVLSSIYSDSEPATIDDKKSFLRRHRIALYDSIRACSIKGSSDASITDVEPSKTEIAEILAKSFVTVCILNGKTAAKYFYKYQPAVLKNKSGAPVKIFEMPSTSPANATFTLPRLIESWKEAFLEV